MLDFAIDRAGELITGIDSDILSVSGDALNYQMAFCRIQSVAKDWYYDHIGADLEELLGEPLDNNNIALLKQKIITALTFDGYFTTDNIYIDASIINLTYAKILVYIKNINNKGSMCIDVSLDLVKGVNVEIGEK